MSFSIEGKIIKGLGEASRTVAMQLPEFIKTRRISGLRTQND
jgi:hypothetical protein